MFVFIEHNKKIKHMSVTNHSVHYSTYDGYVLVLTFIILGSKRSSRFLKCARLITDSNEYTRNSYSSHLPLPSCIRMSIIHSELLIHSVFLKTNTGITFRLKYMKMVTTFIQIYLMYLI